MLSCSGFNTVLISLAIFSVIVLFSRLSSSNNSGLSITSGMGFRGACELEVGEVGSTSLFAFTGFSIMIFLLGLFMGLPLERFLLFLFLKDSTSMNSLSFSSVCTSIVRSAVFEDTFIPKLLALFALMSGRVRSMLPFLVQLGSNVMIGG